MNIRPATQADSKLLFNWRNDPVTRINSRDPREVSWESHVHWLENALAEKSRHLLIAEEGGVPVGTCRVDSDGELSWTIAPEHRGNGYAMTMVQQVIQRFSTPLLAQIKSSNAASLAIVKRLGFEQIADGEMTRWLRTPKDRQAP